MKRFIAFVFALSIISSTVLAWSTTVKNQLNNTTTQIKDAQKDLKENKAEQKDVLKQIDTLDQNINSTETKIATTKDEIARVEKNIKIAEENILYMEGEYDKKYEQRKNRMVSYYKDGSNSLWDIAYDTDDPTEFMYRERLIERILEYDDNLMKEIELEKESIK